jgi:hypothetical protein
MPARMHRDDYVSIILIAYSGISNLVGMRIQSIPARIRRNAQGMVQAWVAHFVTPLKCRYNEYN